MDMVAFSIVGEWLARSGWTHAVTEADVATEGTADSFVKVSHLSKARLASQVTATALYILQKKAYEKYTMNLDADHIPLPFGECA